MAKRANASTNDTAYLVGQHASCESDTAADTCCSGTNHQLIDPTGKVCNVHGFKDDMTAQDVPVGMTATAYTVPGTSDTHILLFHQSLSFGNHMDHSLINPNLIRSNDIPVSDEPFDSTREFGQPRRFIYTV